MKGAGEEAQKERVDSTIQTLQDEKEAELQRHQQRMQELDEEIARVKLEYAKIHNAQLPIMLFPREISLIIFSYLSSSSLLWFTGTQDVASTMAEPEQDRVDNSNVWQPYIPSPSPPLPHVFRDGTVPTAEVTISHVCHAWRLLALSSSELWTTFNCEGYKNGWGDAILRRGTISWLSAYLERSRGRGLNLWFDVPPNSDIEEMMNLISPHTSRWRRFSMRLQTTRDLQTLQSTGPFRAERLETLEIVGQNNGTPGFGAITNSSSFWEDGAPKLSALRVACDILEPCLPASASNITVLQIDKPFSPFAMTWETFLSILQLPSLESLSMADFFVSFTAELGLSHPATSNTLRHFRCTDVSVLCYILASLRAPRLELLILSNMSLDMELIQNWEWQLPFDEHGVRVGPSPDPDYFPLIKTIGFNNCKMYPDKSALLQVLARATRNVTHIMVAVNKPYWEPNMLIDRNNTVHWPDLETISHAISWNGTSNDIKSAGIDLMKTINRRERHYKKHCTHEIEGTFLEALKTEAGSDFWTSLEEGDFHKVVPINSTHGKDSWLPWPPRQKTDFHYSADNRFNQRVPDHFRY